MRSVGVAALAAVLILSAPAKADILVNISKSQQRLAVVVDGKELYRWPVSTGRRGHATPIGTFHPQRLERHWYSHEYQLTPMPWAMFFFRGYAVHGTMEAYNLGHPASHGCVRLRPDHAEALFSLVHRQHALAATRIVVMNGPLPPLPHAAPMADAGTPKFEAVAATHFAAALPDDDVSVDAKTYRDLAPHPVSLRVNESAPAAAAQAHAEAPVAHRISHNVTRGDDAAVMQSRQAWLRGLAHKYGFKEW